MVVILILSGLLISELNAQFLSAGRRGFGLNIGSQIMNGDAGYVGFAGGVEGYAKYVLSPSYFAIGSFGYGELSDGVLISGPASYSTDILHLDLKGGINLLTEGRIIPHTYAGLGAIWWRLDEGWRNRTGLSGHYFGGYFDFSYFFGGGIEYKLNPNISFTTNVDYRFTMTDDIDPTYRTSKNDGFINIKSGLTFYMEPSRFGSGRKIDVAEKTPFDELDMSELSGIGEAGDAASEDELNALIEGIDQYKAQSSSDMAMDQYIQLKSRVDELNDAIGTKELEIEELKSQLQYRKERIGELESNLQTRGGALAASLNVDISDFTASYEQALQQFYTREFDAAIYLFNVLLEANPAHKLASNCQYWIGESYFGKRDYHNAISAFEKVMAYEKSHKKDDALLMMGRSYIQLGDNQLAAKMFNELMTSYPNSEYYDKAQRYASNI